MSATNVLSGFLFLGTCSASRATIFMPLALLHRSASRLTRIVQTEEAMRGDVVEAHVLASKALMHADVLRVLR